ncbi:hypothetical protein PFLUV_G00050490 [Perca fluviatilis]|uniref:Uncharacterized protein n=1 Tax=Perca fluviatilis TaxID=8168 RepID=A0A6A5FDK8_PERFL|nr:hypothetical protein PFLUV_G00050490 [Perca fluviatilis]
MRTVHPTVKIVELRETSGLASDGGGATGASTSRGDFLSGLSQTSWSVEWSGQSECTERTKVSTSVNVLCVAVRRTI